MTDKTAIELLARARDHIADFPHLFPENAHYPNDREEYRRLENERLPLIDELSAALTTIRAKALLGL